MIGTIPVTKVIVTTDTMTISEIDGHRLIVMATAQRLRTDVAKEERITPEVPADQDADSSGGTKTEATHDLRIEILGIGEDLPVEVDHHNEATRHPNRLLTTRRRLVANVVGRNMRTSMIATAWRLPGVSYGKPAWGCVGMKVSASSNSD